MSQSHQPRITAIGLTPDISQKILELTSIDDVRWISSIADFENYIEKFIPQEDDVVLVGNSIAGIRPIEVAQTLRATSIGSHILYVTNEFIEFSLVDIKKNGFSRTLILPFDKIFFEDIVRSHSNNSKFHFKAVKLIDIHPGDILNFSVYMYLPLNQRHTLLNASGCISQNKYNRIKKFQLQKVYVQRLEIEKFYEYAALKIEQLSRPGQLLLSETERQDRLHQTIQELFHVILDQQADSDFQSGKDLFEQVTIIVQKFIEDKIGNEFYRNLSELIDSGDDLYSHSQVVSNMAFLLSLELNIGKPEELAIAGLLHDIGIHGFTEDPNPLAYEHLDKDSLARYKAHPNYSINMLKFKKIALSPMIIEAISKHHERVDGKGFPGSLPAHKIPIEAQLIGFCDLFEYLTRSAPGKKKISYMESIEIIKDTGQFPVDFMIQIKNFFNKLNNTQKKDAA